MRTLLYIIKRVIIGVTIVLLLNLIKSLPVHANTITTDGWFYNMNRIEGSKWYNWSSSTSASELSISWGYQQINYITDNNTGDYYSNGFEYAYKDGITLGSNGVSIGVQTGVYTYHYRLYYATIYVVSQRALSRYSASAFTIGNSYNANMQYSAMTMASVDCSYFSGNYNYCYAVSGIVQSETSGYWLYARLTSSQSTNVAVVGYNIEYIGVLDQVTNASIQSIVSNSGFATASSVSAVQSSVNQVQQEIQGTQDAIDQQTQQQQENHEETINTITDNSTDDPSSSFESFNNSLPSNNTISNLITLPVQLFQKILNSLSSSCTPFNLGNLMGTDIILPCINISNYIGTTLWSVIDILFSGFFVLVIARKMIKAFENFSSMKEGDVLND